MRGRWITPLGLGIAAFLLWWLFRDENPAEIWGYIRRANFGLLLLAVVLTTATFPVRAIRWRYLLAPAQSAAPFRSRFEAVCIGFMANNLLPRAGEFARAYAYSRREPVPAATAFAHAGRRTVSRRDRDPAAAPAGPRQPRLSGRGSPARDRHRNPGDLPLPGPGGRGFRLPVGSARPGRARDRVVRARTLLPARAADASVDLARRFVEGLAALRGWRLMLPALGWSLGVWTLQSLSFWVGFLAFDIHLPFDAALFTNGSVAIASTIPTPGFFGTFHAAAKLALADVYAVAEASALGFAVGWHLGSFFPITIIGLWYARGLGLSLRAMRGRPGDETRPDRPEPGGRGPAE